MIDKRLLFRQSVASSTEIAKHSDFKILGICYFSIARARDFKISFFEI